MSKRFGRNQRRRAREALASANSSIEGLRIGRTMDAGLLIDMGRRLRDADDFARAVGEMVGREAIIAGEPVDTGLTAYRIDGSMRALPNERVQARPSFDIPMSASNVRIEVLRLLDIKVIADSMSRQMHCHVTLDDKTIAYAISDSALLRMTRSELERRMVPEIARQLADELVKTRGRR